MLPKIMQVKKKEAGNRVGQVLLTTFPDSSFSRGSWEALQ